MNDSRLFALITHVHTLSSATVIDTRLLFDVETFNWVPPTRGLTINKIFLVVLVQINQRINKANQKKCIFMGKVWKVQMVFTGICLFKKSRVEI